MDKDNPIYIEKKDYLMKEKTDLNLLIYQTLMGISMLLSDVKNRVDDVEERIEENSPKNCGLPIHQKYSLSVEEAATYFGIGEKRLRALAYEHRGEDFIIEIGTHVRFKRALFEQFLNKTTTV